MKILVSLASVVLMSLPTFAAEPSCLAACSFGDANWYHFACLKKADVGTLIRQYNCDISEVDETSVTCEEIADGVLRDVTSGPVEQAKKQFFAWCGQNGLIPR